MGCPKEGLDLTSDYLYDLAGMICTEENLKKCKDWGCFFIILGGNPEVEHLSKMLCVGQKSQRDLW